VQEEALEEDLDDTVASPSSMTVAPDGSTVAPDGSELHSRFCAAAQD
jgi:hypothetical protein